MIPSSASLDHHAGTRPVPGLLDLSAPTEHRTEAHNPSTRDHEGNGKDVVERRPDAARTKVEPLGRCLTHELETVDENDDHDCLDYGGRKATARCAVHGRIHCPHSSYVFRPETARRWRISLPG